MTIQDVGLTPTAVVKGLIEEHVQALPKPIAPRRSAYLFGPTLDFLGLGGGSLILLAVLLLLAPSIDWYPKVLAWTLLAANVINHPHFAYSYQIFYRNFRAKAFGRDYAPTLRLRYIIAGIVAPVVMAAFVAFCILRQDVILLAYAGNAMGFFVGWHYVKQGYGMIIVDSVLKKRFFNATEKKILLVNAYICWAGSWMLANVALRSVDFWGLKYFSFDIPQPLAVAAIIAALASGGVTFYMLLRKALAGNKPPLNGSIAYFTALYPWLLFAKFDPLFMLIIPAFHSLQYMVVVWRYKINRERDLTIERAGRLRRLGGFAGLGLVLGFMGFWGMPIAMDNLVPYDTAIFGSSLFLFVFWIFINVHHYFLDNVMWRRENPDTGKYLFGRS